MHKILRKFKNILPAPHEYYYYSSGHYYEKLSARYSSLDSYLRLLQRCSQLSREESDLEIKPELGRHIDQILKKYGKPRHQLTNVSPLNNRILFYKFMIGGHKTKCEMHFFRNKLFLFIYTFSYLTTENRAEIVQLLSLKYLRQTTDLNHNKIAGKNGNEIFIQNSVDFTLYYLAVKDDFFQEAVSFTEKTKKETNSRSGLNNSELLNRL
jgi:hypothetical protein